MMSGDPTVVVIVPAHNAGWCLGRCLDGVREAGFDMGHEVIVVDDGSTDDTAQIAQRAGARLLSHSIAKGAAAARAEGAAGQDVDILVFVDADVVPARDVRSRILRVFADGDTTAIFGAYDDTPLSPGWVSQYRNLLHRFVHLTAVGTAQTFWTGLGAVRREAYEAVGGIDPACRMMEDIEFGLRLSDAGYPITLDPEITGTHQKHWGWWSMIRTDLFDRAIPWTELLMRKPDSFGDLNLSPDRKLAALSSVGIGLGLIAGLWHPWGLMIALVSLVAFVALAMPFLRWLSGLRGAGFAAFAVFPHIVHNWCAVAGYAYVKGAHMLGRSRR